MAPTLSNVISRINTGISTVDQKEVVVEGNDRFFLSNGSALSSLSELGSALSIMSDEQYCYHVQNERNDFADWVELILKEPRIAVKLKKSKSRLDAVKTISGKSR